MERPIWGSRFLLNKEYDDACLADVERDVHEALCDDEDLLPVDKDGFPRGTFTVTIKWEDDEE